MSTPLMSTPLAAALPPAVGGRKSGNRSLSSFESSSWYHWLNVILLHTWL